MLMIFPTATESTSVVSQVVYCRLVLNAGDTKITYSFGEVGSGSPDKSILYAKLGSMPYPLEDPNRLFDVKAEHKAGAGNQQVGNFYLGGAAAGGEEIYLLLRVDVGGKGFSYEFASSS